jgi:hypothetical protein
MRKFTASVSTTLLALCLSGCSSLHLHHSRQAPAPPLQTGTGKIDEQQKKAHQGPPPSSLPQPSAQNTPPQLPPEQHPKVKHAKKKRKQAEAETATAHPGAADTAPKPATASSPIGALTTGDDAAGSQTKVDTQKLIQQTEERLKGIGRPLSSDEQSTAEQIRTFLKQARQAIDIGDFDGAQTLATKAKLLLDELNK